jgi:anti-sigma B factor antagonist
MRVNDGDHLAIELIHLDGVAVLALRGEIDISTAPRLREAVQHAIESGVPIVLDMAEVTFMDSSGISTLVETAGVSRGLSSRVQIQRPSNQVRRILSLTGLADVFQLEPDRHDVDGR